MHRPARLSRAVTTSVRYRAQFYKPFAERLGRARANRRLVAAVGAARPRINNLPPARFSHLTDNRKRRSVAEGVPLVEP